MCFYVFCNYQCHFYCLGFPLFQRWDFCEGIPYIERHLWIEKDLVFWKKGNSVPFVSGFKKVWGLRVSPIHFNYELKITYLTFDSIYHRDSIFSLKVLSPSIFLKSEKPSNASEIELIQSSFFPPNLKRIMFSICFNSSHWT